MCCRLVRSADQRKVAKQNFTMFLSNLQNSWTCLHGQCVQLCSLLVKERLGWNRIVFCGLLVAMYPLQWEWDMTPYRQVLVPTFRGTLRLQVDQGFKGFQAWKWDRARDWDDRGPSRWLQPLGLLFVRGAARCNAWIPEEEFHGQRQSADFVIAFATASKRTPVRALQAPWPGSQIRDGWFIVSNGSETPPHFLHWIDYAGQRAHWCSQ